MVPAKSLITALLLLVLAACGPRPGPSTPAAPVAAGEGAEAYQSPPRPEAIAPQATGGWSLSGTGAERSKARLATPAGEIITGNVDKRGRWAMPLGPAAEPRIFGLSTTRDGRTVQGEGYVLVTPSGQAALLRAGAGAVRIDRLGTPGFRTLDFDREGGAVVSASGPADAPLALRLDGRLIAQGRIDRTGRYEFSLPPTLASGAHRLQLSGDRFADALTFQLSPAAPLVQGPMRSQVTDIGLRVDWMTPGGGVQSTILIR